MQLPPRGTGAKHDLTVDSSNAWGQGAASHVNSVHVVSTAVPCSRRVLTQTRKFLANRVGDKRANAAEFAPVTAALLNPQLAKT